MRFIRDNIHVLASRDIVGRNNRYYRLFLEQTVSVKWPQQVTFRVRCKNFIIEELKVPEQVEKFFVDYDGTSLPDWFLEGR